MYATGNEMMVICDISVNILCYWLVVVSSMLRECLHPMLVYPPATDKSIIKYFRSITL